MNGTSSLTSSGADRHPGATIAEKDPVLMTFRNMEGMQVVVRRALSGDFVCDYTRDGESKRNISLLVAPNYKGQKLDPKKLKYFPHYNAFIFCDTPLHYAKETWTPYLEGPAPEPKGSRSLVKPSTDTAFLLNSKLDNPRFKLTSQQSLAVLMECLNRGMSVVEKIQKEEEVVIFLGNIGAGKSTLANYLFGCTLEAVSTQKLGIAHPDPSVIAVKPAARGGSADEVAPIGHTHSRTFMPQLIKLPNQVAVCDCPGFLSDRGFEINAASAINIKRVFENARNIKIVILLSLETLKADRARGLKDLLNLCSGLFGSPENFLKGQSAVLLGITHIPLLTIEDKGVKTSIEPLKHLQDYLKANDSLQPIEKQILSSLADRLFIYDPLNRSSLKYAGALQKEAILERIHALPAIKAAPGFFQTTLSDEDKQEIVHFTDVIHGEVIALSHHSELKEEDYKQLGEHQKCLNGLLIIQHPIVAQSLAKIRATIVSRVRAKVHEFNLLSYEEDLDKFKQSQVLLRSIWGGVRYFDAETKQEVAALFKEVPQNRAQALQPALVMREQIVANAFHTARMRDILFASTLEVERLEGRLTTILNEFSSGTEGLRKSLQSLSEQIQKEVRAGSLTGERMDLAYMIFALHKEMLEGLVATTQQHLELEKQGLSVFGQQLKGTLEVALYARMLEINFIQEKLTFIEKQKDHEWAVAVQVHSHKLAREIQEYDQILKVRELKQNQTWQDFDHRLAKIEQGTQELSALAKLRLQEDQIYHKHQTEMCRLQLQGAREMYNMDVEARLEVAKLLKKHIPQTS